MGLGGSTARGGDMTLGDDQVLLPNWANPSNPKVFFDIEVDRKPLGRIEMTLASDVVPKT
jgi:hypothetical protein